jgi:hypothetical protein
MFTFDRMERTLAVTAWQNWCSACGRSMPRCRQRLLDFREQALNLRAQLLGKRSQDHAGDVPHEDRIAQGVAYSRQCGAGRRLTEVQSARGAGDLRFRQQRRPVSKSARGAGASRKRPGAFDAAVSERIFQPRQR